MPPPFLRPVLDNQGLTMWDATFSGVKVESANGTNVLLTLKTGAGDRMVMDRDTAIAFAAMVLAATSASAATLERQRVRRDAIVRQLQTMLVPD